ncbi:MAG: hydrogenase maturation factor [Lachnospiraceae bacterium]|nr:hydrogenase maturation factor [Lachnospiraceae bacterium]
MLSGTGVGGDCAIFALSSGEAIVTCMQEGRLMLPEYSGRLGNRAEVNPVPVTIPGQEEVKRVGEEQPDRTPAKTLEQLVVKTMNNLAVSGAEAVGIQLTLLLPTHMEEPDIKSIMQEAEVLAEKYEIQIMGGQTRITELLSDVMVVLTGYGKVSVDRVPLSGVKSGMDIVVSKWIGLEGTFMLAREHRESLLSRYPAYLVEEAESFHKYLSVGAEARVAMVQGVAAMHDASEGGIFAALWELAEAAGVGMTVDMKALPLRQETVEVCEHCNRNPYELLSGGSLVMAASDGQALVEALETAGIPATLVGHTTDTKDRILLNGEEVRYMDRPRTDEIYKCV